MLDTTYELQASPAWQDTLRPGDVVLFAFPATEADGAPEMQNRPCLVIDVDRAGAVPTATIAYGTTWTEGGRRRSNVFVISPGATASAGVERPTRFDLDRHLTVTLDRFGPGRSSPVIGHLDARALTRMHAIRARLHALRDIAAERRRERVAGRRRRWRTREDFVVEHRRSRTAARGRGRRCGDEQADIIPLGISDAAPR